MPTLSQGESVRSVTEAEVKAEARRGIAMAGMQSKAHKRNVACAVGGTGGRRGSGKTGANGRSVALIGATTRGAKGSTAPRRAVRALPAAWIGMAAV